MSRVALYARYSSDRQRAASIEDQLRLCREHATARGWKIVSTYADEAASGASLDGRPGMLAMLGAAREGQIDELHVGLKGAMNALFLTDFANKTRWGLRGRIEQGR